MKNALKYLHRTKVEEPDGRGFKHRAHVCIICDCFIIGTEPLKWMTRPDIRAHKNRLSVKAYEAHYNTKLPQCLVDQYKVCYLPGMLLSPRATSLGTLFATCLTCYEGMKRQRINKPPPRLSIANGFVIGSFPDKIEFIDEDGNIEIRAIDVEEDVNDVLHVLLSPK